MIALPAPAAASRMPRLLAVSVWATFATSGIVMVEPAPCDVLFVFTLVLALVTGHAPVASYAGVSVQATGLGFLGVSTATMMLAYDTASTLRFQAITVYLFLVFGLITALIERYGEAFLRVAWSGLLATLLLTCSVAVLARYHLIPHAEIFFRDDSGMRIKSTFKDPNVFGPFVAAGATLLLAEMVRLPRIGVLRLAAFGLSCFCLLLAFSRGAWVNFAVGLAVFAGLMLLVVREAVFTARLLRLGMAVGVLCVPLLGVLLLQTNLLEYLQSRLSLQGYDSERFSTHARALDVATVEVFGIGPGQWVDKRFGIATHNLYLRVLTETGWLGLMSFLAFVLAATTAGIQGLRRRGRYAVWYAAALAVLAGTLVESLVIDTLHWRHFFWFLALPVGLLAHEVKTARALPVNDDGRHAAVVRRSMA